MKGVKEPVNWSAVAAEAFELKLGEIARKQKEKAMETVVSRLRASKIEHANTVNKEGHEAGAAWARDTAEYDELGRLNKLNLNDWFRGEPDAPFSNADHLAFAITGTDADECSRDEAHEMVRDFWGNIDDEVLEHEDFLRGFCEGALSVFEKVEGRL
jgi:hypothetical protein